MKEKKKKEKLVRVFVVGKKNYEIMFDLLKESENHGAKQALHIKLFELR